MDDFRVWDVDFGDRRTEPAMNAAMAVDMTATPAIEGISD